MSLEVGQKIRNKTSASKETENKEIPEKISTAQQKVKSVEGAVKSKVQK